jgi:hypothetical protein
MSLGAAAISAIILSALTAFKPLLSKIATDVTSYLIHFACTASGQGIASS